MLGMEGTRIRVEVNEIPVVKNKKTVAIAGSMVDITEKMYINDGSAGTEMLFKDTGSVPRSKEPAFKSRVGFIKSILSKEMADEQDDFTVKKSAFIVLAPILRLVPF